MLSGGSTESTSLIWLATTLTEQTTPSGRLLVGSTVHFAGGRSLFGSRVTPVVPEPLTWKVCRLPSHTIVNELESTVTASLKVNVMFVFAATSVAPSAGEWAVTAGAESVVKENE